jgi:hypothetical protein
LFLAETERREESPFSFLVVVGRVGEWEFIFLFLYYWSRGKWENFWGPFLFLGCCNRKKEREGELLRAFLFFYDLDSLLLWEQERFSCFFRKNMLLEAKRIREREREIENEGRRRRYVLNQSGAPLYL